MTGVETVMGQYATARTFPELQLSDVLTPFGTDFVNQACGSGTVAFYAHCPGTEHLQVVTRAADDYLAWIDYRFAGKAAPSSCK
jgi:hypothetical protein